MAGADHERVAHLEAATRAEAQSAKWMAAGLGGVGALLLGAIQLANLGGLEGAGRIALAVVAGVVAAGGLVTALVATVGAMMPYALTLRDLQEAEAASDSETKPLRDWIEANRARLLRAEERVADLATDYEAALEEEETAFAEYYDDPDDPEKERKAVAAGQWVLYLNGLVGELLAEAKLHMTRRAVRRSRNLLLGMSAAVALGIVGLIFATTQPEAPAVDLRGGDLSGATLGEVELREANLNGETIKGANLYGADLRDAQIKGTKWVDTICPDGVDSANAGGTCSGHLKP